MSKWIVAAAVAAVGVASAAQAAILTDFDTVQQLTYSAAGGTSLSVVDGPLGGGKALKITTANAYSTWGQFTKLTITGAAAQTLKDATALQVNLQALNAEISDDFNIRLILNTNAWPVNPANNYRSLGEVWMAGTSDVSPTINVNIAAGSELAQTFDRIAAGGYWYEFFLDTSWNGIAAASGPQTFYVNDVQATVPEPAMAGLAMVAAVGILARRARA